jgi:hypothetical protein
MTTERNPLDFPVETHTRAVAIQVSKAEAAAPTVPLTLMLVVNGKAQVLPQLVAQ